MNTAPYGQPAGPSSCRPTAAPRLRLRVIRFPLLPATVPFSEGGWAPLSVWLGDEAPRALFSALYEVFPRELLAGEVTPAMADWAARWLLRHVDDEGEVDVALVGPEEESLLVRDWTALSRRN